MLTATNHCFHLDTSLQRFDFTKILILTFILLLLDLCSHQRSVELYAESKYHPKEFIAVQCPFYVDYYENKCKGNLQTYVGYAASDV